MALMWLPTYCYWMAYLILLFNVEVHHSAPDENGSRKRERPASAPSASKACKEKIRRGQLNDRPPKAGKAVILKDAIRLLTRLRDETKKLKETSENLQHKLTELKAEKIELRDEKQRLKFEKEKLEMQVKVFTMQPSFLLHPATFPAPFATQSKFGGGKFGPYISYLECPCGSSCLLQQLILHRIMSFAHLLLDL